jgi:hypothetical protein
VMQQQRCGLPRQQRRHGLPLQQLPSPCLRTSPRAPTRRHLPMLVGRFSKTALMLRRWLIGARASTL